MPRHRTLIATLALLLLTTVGCAAAQPDASKASAPAADSTTAAAPEPTPEQLDLTGDWTWKNSPDPAKTMTATITADRIEIRWPSMEVGDEGDPISGTMDAPLYWAGSFTPPAPGETEYTFVSKGDTGAMQKSLLASTDAEKKFGFANDAITFDITIQGQTKTLSLTRD